MKCAPFLWLLLLAFAGGAEWSAAAASNVVFQPASGNWNVPTNWSGGIVPDTNQNPIVRNGGIVTVDANVGACSSMFIGQSSAANPKATVLFRPGAMLTTANLLLGRDGTNYGQFNQSGGVLTVNGYVSVGDGAGGGTGASGEFNLSAGTLQMAGGGSYVRVGHQGVGRMLVAGSAVLNTPTLSVGNTVGSSGSQLFQWGGMVNVGNLTVGSTGASNCSFTISSGVVQWGGLLLIQDLLTAQGMQFWLQRTNTGGIGLQLTDTGTLRLELDAQGVAPIHITGSQISIAPGSKLIVDGTRFLRWNGRPGMFPLVQHAGYAAQSGFAASNVTFTGFGALAPALAYTTNAITLVLTGPTNGLAQMGQGLFCEYWELPINQDSQNRGQVITAPLAALPGFTNSLVVTHPVFGKTVSRVDLAERLRDTNYFMRFSGYVSVPTNGSYTFYLNSDDGARLWLDDGLVVDNDGAHTAAETGGTTNLTAGLHRLQIGYFQNTGSATLELRWAGPGLAKQLIADTALFLTAQPEGWVRQPLFRNVTYDQDLNYNYAPSFIYDETEGLYKIWMCASGSWTGPGDYVIYKEATSLAGLLAAPLLIALAPSHDPTKFDQVHACDPNVYRVGDLYYLTYSGNTDNTQLSERTRIGMAVSYDRGRTFQRLHGGVHNIEPNTNTYAGGYGAGQSAVVQANDGFFYMIYTDSDGGGAPLYQRVVRSPDPAFAPGSFTNVANLTGVGNSVDLAYDVAKSQFIIVAQLKLIYFASNWTELRRVDLANPFAWDFGEGHGLLMDSQKHPVRYDQDGVSSYVFAAATTENTNNTSLWANWVEGDLKYLILPQTLAPVWTTPQVISEGYSFAGNSGSVIGGNTLTNTNNFTVDFWARPDADTTLPTEAISGVAGTSGQRYIMHPEIGGTWGAGHAGMGVSLGRNGIVVAEHASGYLPALLTWNGEITDWVHVAVVYTNKTPWLYVDGTFVDSGLTSTQSFVHPTARNFGGGTYGYFVGQAWNFRVWNRPLTAAEVALLSGATAETNLAAALAGKWLQDPALNQSSPNGTKTLDATLAGAEAGENYSYQLADDGSGRFTITGATGLVTVLNQSLLNFATNTPQAFTVRAVDGQQRTFDRQFIVSVTATNDRPNIAAMSNAVRIAGATLAIATPASDPDVPSQPLTFSLLAAPTGATVNASSGLISWRPLIAQGGSSNFFRIKVTDNGVPALAATQTFSVIVTQPAKPVASNVSMSNGQFTVTISGDSGPDYTVYAATNLINWLPVWTNNAAPPPFTFTDPAASNFNRRFYRVLLGP